MPRDLAANLGEVQGETTLVAADIKRAASRAELPSQLARSSVVGALVEKRSGLLACVGVVVKSEVVEMELRAGGWPRGIGKPQRIETGRGQALQLTDARIGALQNGRRFELFTENAHAGLRYHCVEQPFGQALHYNEIAVLVDDQAGQLVGFAKTEAAGIVGGVEHWFAARDGCAQAQLQQIQPSSLIESLARDKAQGDLRRGTIERGAQEDSAIVGHGQERFFRIWRSDCFYVGRVDPKMTGAEAISGAAADHGSWGRRVRDRPLQNRLGAGSAGRFGGRLRFGVTRLGHRFPE